MGIDSNECFIHDVLTSLAFNISWSCITFSFCQPEIFDNSVLCLGLSTTKIHVL